MKPTQVMIEGQLWAIVPSRRKDMESPNWDGECDYESQTIRVYRELPLPRKIEITIHEILHAQQPDIAEDAIYRRSREITRALIKTGLLKRGRR